MSTILYIPFWEFMIITLFYAAIGFGMAWAIQALRRPPPPR